MPIDRVKYQLLNNPKSYGQNTREPGEHDDLFMETVPPDLDVVMMENMLPIGIERDENCVDGMKQVLDIFLYMRLSHSDKTCNAGFTTIEKIHNVV